MDVQVLCKARKEAVLRRTVLAGAKVLAGQAVECNPTTHEVKAFVSGTVLGASTETLDRGDARETQTDVSVNVLGCEGTTYVLAAAAIAAYRYLKPVTITGRWEDDGATRTINSRAFLLETATAADHLVEAKLL